MEFELVVDARLELAETPIWDQRVNRLYFTDLFKGEIHRYNPEDGTEELFKTHQLIGAAIPCKEEGKLVCALEKGIFIFNMADNTLSLIADPNGGNTENRYNDTRVDAAGRIFTSTVSRLYGSGDYKPDMRGDFYMIDTDHSVKLICGGINQYNGIVWNHDNTRMFVVDTYHEQVLSFPYDIAAGPVGEPEVVLDFKDGQGMPDGMSIDSRDSLYVCHWTGKVSVWDKSFCHITDMKLPVEFGCCGGFGGKDQKDFYVTTSHYGYTEEDRKKNPGAGGLFLARTKTAGRLDYFY